MFSRWICDSGVSRGTSTSLRSSFKATEAARWIRFCIAPEAPVTPRKTRTAPRSLRALRGLEKDREVVEGLGAERLEPRHRRARVDARRALQVADLEVDAEMLRSDRRQVGCTEVRRAGA